MRDIERYAALYPNLPFEATQARYRRKLVLAQIAALKPARLLEIGCGLEPLFTSLPPHIACCVVEPSQGFAERARYLARNHPQVVVIQASFEAFEVPEHSGVADLIILSGLLHEVDDPAPLLARARALCGPRTVVHVNVPNARSMHRLLGLEMGLISDLRALSPTQALTQQHRTFTVASLRGLVESAGLRVTACESYFVKPFTHAQMQDLVDQGLLTDAMLDGLYRLARHLPEVGSEIYVNAVSTAC